MKINKMWKTKNLTESKYIKEASEGEDELIEINPQNANIEEIAGAVKDDLEDSSNGEVLISDEQAHEIASEIKDTAEEVNAGQTAIVITSEDYEDAKIETKLSKVLDKAYATAKEAMNNKTKNGANVLIEGLPGSGKTAIVESWCADNGLILVAMNATDPKLESAINGIPLRDTSGEDNNALVYLYAKEVFKDLLDPANKGKCVLFVDELNRQKSPQLRRPFMSLFNEKRNASGSLDFRENLLFSVVCINPFGVQFHDKGVDELTPAEKNRFLFKRTGAKSIDSAPENSLNYFKGWHIKKLLDLGIIAPDTKASANHNGHIGPTRPLSDSELDFAKSVIRQYVLATHILTHPVFEFNGRDDADQIYKADADYLTSRMLTDGIAAAKGYPDKFLEWVDEDACFIDDTTKMFHEILDTFILDENSYYKRYNLFGDSNVNLGNSSQENEEDTYEDDEDDSLLFGNSGTSGKSTKIPGTFGQEVKNIVGSW